MFRSNRNRSRNRNRGNSNISVAIYANCNFEGRNVNFSFGKNIVNNQRIGSMKVAKGSKITFFQNKDFTGTTTTLNRSLLCLKDFKDVKNPNFNWHNKIGSFIIEVDNSTYGETPKIKKQRKRKCTCVYEDGSTDSSDSRSVSSDSSSRSVSSVSSGSTAKSFSSGDSISTFANTMSYIQRMRLKMRDLLRGKRGRKRTESREKRNQSRAKSRRNFKSKIAPASKVGFENAEYFSNNIMSYFTGSNLIILLIVIAIIIAIKYYS